MENIDRIQKLKGLNKLTNSIDEDLRKKLEFEQDKELYQFVYENNFVLLTDNIEDNRYFVLTINEYFILKHLSENSKRPMGVLESCKDLGIKVDEGKFLFNYLKDKKLVKEVQKGLYMREYYASLITFGYFGYRYIEDKYYITVSNVKNNVNKFDEDKYKALNGLRTKKKIIVNLSSILIISGLVLFIASLIELLRLNYHYGISFFIISFFLLNVRFFDELKYFDSKISEIENEIELNDINATNFEKRAEKLFRSHQIELAQYYNEILRQSKKIFNWGISCLFLGMSLIVVSIILIVFKRKLNLQIEDSKLITFLSSLGGIFANVVGGFYMNMYNKTIKSLDSFHKRFVNTHHLHFGNLLLSKIEDKDIRENAYASIFKDMIAPEEHKDLE